MVTEAAAPTEVPPTEAPPPTEVPATEAPTAAPPEKNTIIIGTTDTIASLDPADAYAVHDWELIKNTGEGLLKWKPGTTELQPGLAVDFPEISEDGLTYTFKLRPGIKFADGLDLTASLYASQLNRLLTIGPTCPNNVAGALATPYVESITAPDEETVVIQLKSAVGFFSQILAGAPYVPSHPDIFKADECVLFPEAPIYGVGPWFISQYTQGEQVVLEPNPNYNGELTPQVDQIIVKYFRDPQTLSLAVQNGEVDIAWRFLGPELVGQLEGIPDLAVKTIDSGPIRYLIINHTMAPMDDPNVRSRQSRQPSTAMRFPTWYTTVRLRPCTRRCHQVSWVQPRPSIPCTSHRISTWRMNTWRNPVTLLRIRSRSISGTRPSTTAQRPQPGWS